MERNDTRAYGRHEVVYDVTIGSDDHRPITEILGQVTAVHHHEPAAFSASTFARR